MPVVDLCHGEIVTLHADDTVVQATQMMRHFHVGAVVVVADEAGKHVPVGIVTDRDIDIGVIAPELDPKVMTVGDIIQANLTVVKEDIGIFEAIQMMSSKGVRRLPVVRGDGELIGIVTLDDLFIMMTKEFCNISELLTKEQANEAQKRR